MDSVCSGDTGLYRYRSKNIAGFLFLDIRYINRSAKRIVPTGCVRKKALAVFGKKPSNECQICQELFRRFC